MESDRNGGAAQDGTTVVDFNRRTFYSCVLFLNRSEWGPRLSTSSVSRREVVIRGSTQMSRWLGSSRRMAWAG